MAVFQFGRGRGGSWASFSVGPGIHWRQLSKLDHQPAVSCRLKSKRSLSCGAIVAFLLALHSAAQELLRALILSGGTKGEWRDSTAFLKRLMEDSKRFEVRINETPEGVTKQSLGAFDVVIDNCAGAISDEAENVLQRFVESGKGLVVTRQGLEAGRSAF